MTLEKAYELNEENKLPNGVTGIAVFDIDDTLVKANSSVIKIYKSVNGREIAISTAQFATDPDKEKMGKNVVYYNKTNEAPSEGIAFSIREFRDPTKVYNSITQGTPIIRNLRILDDKIKAGWDIAFADKNVRKNKDITNDTQLKNKFITDCVTNGYTNDLAIEIWQEIENAVSGGYSFNKSHSTSYAVLSYKTAWLKHYYPVYWYACL